MKPTTMLTVVALALGSASCVSDVQSVQIKYAMAGAIDSGCQIKAGTVQQSGGSVDLGWTSSYLVALSVESNMEPDDWTSGGDVVHSGSRNDFYLSELILAVNGVSVAQPRTGFVEAGGGLSLGLRIDMTEIAAAAEPGADLAVDISLKGKFANGAEYQTAPFRFPISVYNSGTTKPACDLEGGDTVTPLGGEGEAPCGNWGQDGLYYYCKPDDSGA